VRAARVRGVPAILFFIPGADSAASVLPGHRLAKAGLAARALRLYSFSTLASAALACASVPLLLSILPQAFPLIKPLTPFALSAAVLAMVCTERTSERRLACGAAMLSAGALGLAAFGSGMADPFLPAFSGLFAIPAAAASLKGAHAAPAAPRETGPIAVSGFFPAILLGFALGCVADAFPGMGSAAQVALFASIFVALDSERFLCLAASVSSAHLVSSFAYSAAIGKARTGAAAQISSILGGTGAGDLPVIIGAALASVAVSSAAVFLLSKKLVSLSAALDQKALSACVLVLLPAASFLAAGWPGLALTAAASLVGALPLVSGARRVGLTGFVLIPALLASIPI